MRTWWTFCLIECQAGFLMIKLLIEKLDNVGFPLCEKCLFRVTEMLISYHFLGKGSNFRLDHPVTTR